MHLSSKYQWCLPCKCPLNTMTNGKESNKTFPGNFILKTYLLEYVAQLQSAKPPARHLQSHPSSGSEVKGAGSGQCLCCFQWFLKQRTSSFNGAKESSKTGLPNNSKLPTPTSQAVRITARWPRSHPSISKAAWKPSKIFTKKLLKAMAWTSSPNESKKETFKKETFGPIETPKNCSLMSFKVLQIPGWKSRAARPTWKAESCCFCKLQLNAASCNPLQIHSSSCKPLQNRLQLNAASCNSLKKKLQSAPLQSPSNCKLSTKPFFKLQNSAKHPAEPKTFLDTQAQTKGALQAFFKLSAI